MKCFANCQKKTSQMSTVNQKRRWRPTLKRRRESGEGKGSRGSGTLSNPWRQQNTKNCLSFFSLSVFSQSKFTVCFGANRGVADRTSAGQASGSRSLITLFSQPKKEKSRKNAGEKRKCRPASYYNLIVLQFSLAPINIFCVFVNHTWCNSQKNLRMADYPDSSNNNKYSNNNNCNYNNN